MTPIPSATVIPLRERDTLEVLLLRRNKKLVFHGGDWVFPGGRVDDEDRQHDELATARHTAVREAHEEAALVLTPEQLVPFAHWTTPEIRPRRYATWFFVAHADTDARADGVELTEARWWPLAEALRARDAGTIGLPPPTFVSITLLQTLALREALAPRLVERIVPRVIAVEGGECALYPGDAGYSSSDPTCAGARHRGWYLRSGWRYERDDHDSA
ncbi:MAG: NUDIX domain-containing protein [Myxococcota bacterium]